MPQSTSVCLQTVCLFPLHYYFDRMSCAFGQPIITYSRSFFFYIVSLQSLVKTTFIFFLNWEKFIDKCISTPEIIATTSSQHWILLTWRQFASNSFIARNLKNPSTLEVSDQKIILRSIRLILEVVILKKFCSWLKWKSLCIDIEKKIHCYISLLNIKRTTSRCVQVMLWSRLIGQGHLLTQTSSRALAAEIKRIHQNIINTISTMKQQLKVKMDWI